MSFKQGAIIITLDSREMNKHIFAAINRRDKSETLITIKPFY
nr:MAG TPA: hypothetical protein [Caudoviricetes sp.]